MDKKQLKAMVAVNLRLVNPQFTDQYRKKGKSGPAMTRRLFFRYLLNSVIFMMIYGYTMFSLDFSKMPGMFTFYVGLFVLLMFSQSISGIYNIFFAGKDLDSYLPLPFRQKEIFLSKMIVVASSIIPFTLPLLVVFFVTGWHFGIMIPIAIILALVVYVLLAALVLLICSLIVFELTKTKIFREHQTVVMNVLMAATILIAMGGIFLMSGRDNYVDGTISDREPVAILLPLFQIFERPLSVNSGATWLSLLALLVVFIMLLKYLIWPHLNDQLTLANTVFKSTSNRRKKVRRRGLRQMLRAYNLQLLKEPNLLLQVVSNSIMVPFVFVLTFAFGGTSANLGALPLKWLGVFFVAGLSLAAFTTNQTTLVGNLISLDRKNFEFVSSLPISMRYYLKQKFLLGYFIQLGINVVMIVILTLILKMSLIMFVATMVGTAWGTYIISLHYFSRDYHLRLTNWTNITQLFNRGGGNLGMLATMFASIFIGTIMVVIYGFAIAFVEQAWFVNMIATLLLLGSSLLSVRHYQQKFWQQF